MKPANQASLSLLLATTAMVPLSANAANRYPLLAGSTDTVFVLSALQIKSAKDYGAEFSRALILL